MFSDNFFFFLSLREKNEIYTKFRDKKKIILAIILIHIQISN